MQAHSRIPPCDIIVFGGTGDLAVRKLLPALYLRDRNGQLTNDTRIIAVSRAGLDDVGYRAKIHGELGQFLPSDLRDASAVRAFTRRLHHVTLDVQNDGEADSGWHDLAVTLPDSARARVFYLASAAKLFGPICHGLHRFGLITDQARVVLEKPIGNDLASARRINDEVGAVFDEEQIFRIDHYLGKETVQNLLVLRFANAMFEPLWNSGAIDHVQITVSESLGVGGRTGYYENSGALRDMVQNHLLQLLCLVAMEPPARLEPEAVRNEKLKVLQALRPLKGTEVQRNTVRGHYAAGVVGGQFVPGYSEELDGTPSTTETFVAIRAEVRNWRWSGVPFYLRTGKRLDRTAAEIIVQFRGVPHSVFRGIADTEPTPNQLVLRLQPDEGVHLRLVTKEPGPGGLRLRSVPLNLSFAETFGSRLPDAYERLLGDVMRGDPTLFMRRDEIETAWSWIAPILEAWSQYDQPLRAYPAGSSGPAAAIALIERDGRTWHEENQ
ncbi:glucose-6-phosphate dehydrogenase [Nocardia sp. NPDC004722]